MYAAAIVICSAANVIVRQSFMLAMFHLGMKIRVSLCSLLYRKASTDSIHIYALRTATSTP
jgi:ATP-binding cassette subfamily C (CFTR/MRP) protein 4